MKHALIIFAFTAISLQGMAAQLPPAVCTYGQTEIRIQHVADERLQFTLTNREADGSVDPDWSGESTVQVKEFSGRGFWGVTAVDADGSGILYYDNDAGINMVQQFFFPKLGVVAPFGEVHCVVPNGLSIYQYISGDYYSAP